MEHGRHDPHGTSDAGTPTDAERGRLVLLARVCEQMGEAVAVYDNDDRVIYVNGALAQMHGCAPEALIGMDVRVFLEQPEAYAMFAAERELLERDGDGSHKIEMTSRLADGSTTVAQVTVTALRDDDGQRLGRIVCVQDVSARRALEKRLERAASFDPLTDLANRRLLYERLANAVPTSTDSMPAALFYIDLDGFKLINDEHGHDVGDELLCLVAARLRTCARDEDTLARLGGDEFVLLVEGVESTKGAEQIAARIVSQVGLPYQLGGLAISVSASVGVALGAFDDRRSLVHAADIAMYQAKARGHGKVVIAPEPVVEHSRGDPTRAA